MTEAPFSTLTRAAADDLERVLARLDWTLLDFEQRELAAGTAVAVACGRIRFHYVVSGSVQLTGGVAPLRLEAGDFLMLPQSEAHRIRAERDSVVASGELDAATVPGLPLASALPASLTACGFVVREPHMARSSRRSASSSAGCARATA